MLGFIDSAQQGGACPQTDEVGADMVPTELGCCLRTKSQQTLGLGSQRSWATDMSAVPRLGNKVYFVLFNQGKCAPIAKHRRSMVV